MEIQAAVLHADARRFSIEPAVLDDPEPDEAVVRLVGVGICHTDLFLRDHAMIVPRPAVLGHEGAGIVERVGMSVSEFAVGDPVVISFASCGHCRRCRSEMPAYCDSFAAQNLGDVRRGAAALRLTDGTPISRIFGQSSFATHALVRARNLVAVARDVPLVSLGPFGCGFQTGAGAVLNVLRPMPGSSIGIFGVGSVGLAALIAARSLGCRDMIAIDRSPSRLALAAELGATGCVEANGQDLATAIRASVPLGLDGAIDTTGAPEVIEAACAALDTLGVLVLAGVGPLGAKISADMGHLLNGRMIRGTIEGDSDPRRMIPDLIEHLRAGRMPFDSLITPYRFADINQAVIDLAAGRIVKAVLTFDEPDSGVGSDRHGPQSAVPTAFGGAASQG